MGEHGFGRFGTRLAAIAMITAGATATGCYRHVVGARGPGAERVTVHEPNLKDERIPIVDDVEDALLGPEPAPRRRP